MNTWEIVVPLIIIVFLRALKWRGTFKINPFLVGLFVVMLVSFIVGGKLVSHWNVAPVIKPERRLKSAVLDQDSESEQSAILFVGASHTYRGVIPSLIEEQIQKHKANYNFISLSLGGMGMLEQDYYLDKYLQAVENVPEVVLFEISKRFENPIREYNRVGVDERMLPMTDFTRYVWAVKYMKASNDFNSLGKVSYLKFLNSVDVGALSNGVRSSNMPPLDQAFFYGVQEATSKKHKSKTSPLMINYEQWEEIDYSKVPPAELSQGVVNWVDDFRRYQTVKLKRLGVKYIGFYVPPVLPEDYHAYSLSICEKQECFRMSNSDLKSQMAGDYWYNATHLNKKGAHVYSSWIGENIMEYLRHLKSLDQKGES